jgi:hypothetical protein
MLSTTMSTYGRTLHDNVTGSTALLDRLRRKNRIKPWSGGIDVREPLMYAFNNTFMFYTGYEFLNVTPTEVIQSAVFPLKQAAISVSISGREQRQNRGPAEIIDLIEARMENARLSATHYFNQSIYSDGSAFNGKAIQGLAAMVSKTPEVGTIGGIDAAENVWWRNQAVNAANDPKGPLTRENITDYFNQVSVLTTRGNERPDLIIVDDYIWLEYLASLQAIQRITGDGSGDAGHGFTSVKYYGGGSNADVVLDGGRGGSSIPSKTAYFLNTNYITLREDPERKWSVVGGDRMNTNQDAITRLMLWMGAMTISNRSAQAVLYDTTA